MATWLKLDVNILDNRKIRLIRKYPEGDSLFTMWVGMLCMAMDRESAKLYVAQDVPFSPEDLAALLELDLKVVQMGLSLFTRYDMVSIDDDGVIDMIGIKDHQSLDKIAHKRALGAERQRRFRANKPLQTEPSNAVTRYGVTGNPTDIEVEIEEEEESITRGSAEPAQSVSEVQAPPKRAGKASEPYADEFEAIWESYPKKRDRKAALRAYQSRRREDIPREELARAVAGYRQAVKTEQKEDQYIMAGKTFFGPNERYVDYVTYSAPKAKIGASTAGEWTCINCGKVQLSTASYCMGCGADR